ncbi:MAG: hypothetical protein RIS29_116 [Bacteroidota bacterium]|jgi:hypothetical protein
MKKLFHFNCLFIIGVFLFTSCTSVEDNFSSITGKTNPLSIQTASLLNYFPFETSAYTTIRSYGIDSSKVVLGENVSFVRGQRGYCFQGDTAKSYIQYGVLANGSIRKMHEFSISSWVKLSATSVKGVAPLIMINGGDTLSGNGTLAITVDTLMLKCSIYSDSAKINSHELKISRSLLPSGEWQHLVWTYNSKTSCMTVYLNGKKQGQDTCYARVDTIPNIKTGALKLNMVNAKMQMTKMYIGAWAQQVLGTATATMKFFNGNLDEMHIWNMALTDEDVNTLYNAELALSKK